MFTKTANTEVLEKDILIQPAPLIFILPLLYLQLLMLLCWCTKISCCRQWEEEWARGAFITLSQKLSQQSDICGPGKALRVSIDEKKGE